MDTPKVTFTECPGTVKVLGVTNVGFGDAKKSGVLSMDDIPNTQRLP